MGTVNVTLGDATQLNLILGQQNENEVTEVVFDYAAWKTAYGSGTLSLSVQRPGDQQPYAVVMTTSGDTATWEVSSLDTAYNGTGEIQLTYTVGTLVKKSVVYMFTVYGSIGANGEYPSPGQTWQEEIEDDIADIKADLSDVMQTSEIQFTDWVVGNAYRESTNKMAFNNADVRSRLVQTSINPSIKSIVAKTGYLFSWYACTRTGNDYYAVADGGWLTYADVSDYTKDYYLIITVKNSSGTTISPSEAFENIVWHYDLMDKVNSTNLYLKKFAYGETPTAPYNDFNTFPVNETVCIFANTVSNNNPNPTKTNIVKTIATSSNGAIKLQIAYTVQIVRIEALAYVRIFDGANWRAWQPIYTSDMYIKHWDKFAYGETPTAPYDDFNTFPVNESIVVFANTVSNNNPAPTTLLRVTTSASGSAYTIKYQLAFPLIDPSNTTSIIAYYRYNYGTGWSSWASIRNSAENTMITVNPTDNLVDAINTAFTAGNTTIIVNGGTHDMLSEYGIENSDTSFANDFDFYGPKIGNNCKIIGINGAKLTANYSGSVDDVKTKFSILNVISNCEIIGLDMEVTNVRYCVHDDPNNLYHSNLSGYRVVYKDCIMKHNGSDGSYSAPACIGAGTTQASEHVIERCRFTSPSTYQNAVTYHNNSGNKTGKVTITNCAFLNDCTIRLYAMEETGSYIDSLICGNYIGANINIEPSTTDRFDLVSFNNTVY